MSFASLLVRDVTILRATTGTDRYGNVTPDWANPTRDGMKGWLGRDSESEDGATRDGLVTTWTLRLHPGTAITAGDRVEIDAVAYEVDGPPNRPWTPRGEHHVRARLRLVEG